MAPPAQDEVCNLLLKRLSGDDYALLASELQPCRFERGATIFKRAVPLEHVYFLERGLGSLIATSPEGQKIEAGLFGRDGFTPTSLALGSDRSAYDCIMQLPGDGSKITIVALRAAMEQSPDLRQTLLRYAETLALQTSYTALSNAVHQIDERLARWLLMCHDRSESDEMPLTHDFLSIMLAVRRPSVTNALHVLEGNGFIEAERGWITIRDRDALQEFAGDAYGIPEAEYERLLGPLR